MYIRSVAKGESVNILDIRSVQELMEAAEEFRVMLPKIQDYASEIFFPIIAA